MDQLANRVRPCHRIAKDSPFKAVLKQRRAAGTLQSARRTSLKAAEAVVVSLSSSRCDIILRVGEVDTLRAVNA
jgi:hypothetical protein